MSLSGISGLGLTGYYAQTRQPFQTLASAVSSGVVSQAQQALAASQVSPQTPAAGTQSSQSSIGLDMQIETDLWALFSAIQTGDTAGAQKALTSLEQITGSTQSAGGASQTSQPHHHYRGGGGHSSSSNATSATPRSTGPASSDIPTSLQAIQVKH
jgi:hypothetical protein